MNTNFQELTILIIDDSALDCNVYNAYLIDRNSTEPMTSLTCMADAIALCQSRSPDLILLNFGIDRDRERDFIAALQLEAGDLPLPAIGILSDRSSRTSSESVASGGVALALSLLSQSPPIDRRVASSLPSSTPSPLSLAAKLSATQALLVQRERELIAFETLASQKLRAPLKGIANLATWLGEDLESYLTPDTRKQFDLLQARIRQMAASIDGLLDYLQAGQQPITRSLVDVGQLLTKIIDSFKLTAGFSIEIADTMPIFRTDRFALQQVFTHLLENAIERHDCADGRVRIVVQSQQNFYLFEIIDDGLEIASQDRERIFDVFQSLSPQTDDPNTGMGLAIAKKKIELQGGKLWVESTPEIGSKFSFTWLMVPLEP